MTKIRINLEEAYPPFQIFLRDRPIIGYRTWRLVFAFLEGGLQPRLASHMTRFVWMGPIQRNSKEPVIFDSRVRRKIDRNLLGFYTKRSAREAVKHFSHREIGAIGQISMFGRVIEHEAGFRAQHVRVDHVVLLLPRIAINAGCIEIFHPLDAAYSTYQAIPGNYPLCLIKYKEIKYRSSSSLHNMYDPEVSKTTFPIEKIESVISDVYHCDVMTIPIQDSDQVYHYYEFMESEEDPE